LTGVVLRIRRVPNSGIVVLRLLAEGGARSEPTPGLALLSGRLLTEGTSRHDWRAIVDATEAHGMAVQGVAGFDAHGLVLQALAADVERALDWAAALWSESVFPADRFDLLRRQAIAELESLEDQADVVTGWAFMEQLYAPHPLARRLQGSAESLARLEAGDCAAYHATPRRLIVSVAGDVDEERIRARLDAAFRPAGGPAEPVGSPVEPPSPAAERANERRVRTRAEDQAHLFVGHRTVPRAHPDLAALEVLAVILGGGAGLAGRIPRRIREREALAYTASASTASGAGFDAGRLVAYVGTAPDTVERARDAVVEELVRLLAEGLGDEEVEEARGFLLGRDPFRRETASQWADLMTEAALYGIPVDDPEWAAARIAALSRPDIEAAARRHLDPGRLSVTIGLPGRRRRRTG
jgi:zinc protease